MQDGKYHDALGFDTVEDGVRKPRNNSATHFPVDMRVYLREPLDIVERKFDHRKKLLAKAGTLPFVKCVAAS